MAWFALKSRGRHRPPAAASGDGLCLPPRTHHQPEAPPPKHAPAASSCRSASSPSPLSPQQPARARTSWIAACTKSACCRPWTMAAAPPPVKAAATDEIIVSSVRVLLDCQRRVGYVSMQTCASAVHVSIKPRRSEPRPACRVAATWQAGEGVVEAQRSSGARGATPARCASAVSRRPAAFPAALYRSRVRAQSIRHVQSFLISSSAHTGRCPYLHNSACPLHCTAQGGRVSQASRDRESLPIKCGLWLGELNYADTLTSTESW